MTLPSSLDVAQQLAAVDTVGGDSTSAAVRRTTADLERAARRSIDDEDDLQAILEVPSLRTPSRDRSCAWDVKHAYDGSH